MTGRVQSLRSNTPGVRPSGEQPGTLFVNWADSQLSAITKSGGVQDLIGVRFFSTATTYAVGDFVVQAGQLYRAVAPSTGGAFVPSHWAQIGGSVGIGVAPSNPQPGTLWWDSTSGQLFVWYTDVDTSQWVIANNMGGSPNSAAPPIAIGDTAPATPIIGALWFDTVGAQLYVWFGDGSSNQWVATSNQMGGGYLQSTGGKLSGPLNPAGGIIGVTNGLPAAAGMVGELIEASGGVTPMSSGVPTNICSISIPAGDWDITGEVNISLLSGTAAGVNGWIGQWDAIYPGTQSVTSSNSINGQSVFASCVLPTRTVHINLAATTTYYLGVQASWDASSSVQAGGGYISARRMR